MNCNHQILLIEGDPVSRYLAEKQLKGLYPHKEIISLETGESAFEYLADHPCPAYVLATYRLTGMSGYEFFREFKTRGYSCENIGLLSDGILKEHTELSVMKINVLMKPVTKEKLTSIFRKTNVKSNQ